MAVTIRTATEADAAVLHEVAAIAFPLACPPSAAPEAIADFVATQLSLERFAGYLADPDRVLLLAEADGVPAGYTMLVLGEPSDPDVVASITTRPTAELSKCYVLPGHHGQGVAASLMTATLDAAAGRGAAAVWLGVNNENARANRFYEKHGFARVGTKRFLMGDRYESDYVRERVFAA